MAKYSLPLERKVTSKFDSRFGERLALTRSNAQIYRAGFSICEASIEIRTGPDINFAALEVSLTPVGLLSLY